ncbi:phospholipase D family protein [Shewanella maritima]|uniref:phospholipase D family protein n=1 Tax=Shewanella maritima TaxID=2520507 RepID=UPI003735FDD6
MKIIGKCCFLAFIIIVFSGCTSHYIYPNAPLEYKLPQPIGTPLADYYQQYFEQYPIAHQNTALYPLGDGIDAFIARLATVEMATEAVDVQYYIYRNDDTSKILTLFLMHAANRGVRVRLLLDDMGTSGLDSPLMSLSNHPNVSVRMFNPIKDRKKRVWSFLSDFGRVNHRMHNKSLTVDNMLSIVGGRNIGNEYFSADENVEFGDFDVLLMGPAVDEVSDQFDLYWNASQVKPIEQLVEAFDDLSWDVELNRLAEFQQIFEQSQYYTRLNESEFLKQLLNDKLHWYHVNANVIFDPPNKLSQIEQANIVDDLTSFFDTAASKVLIISPYFVPTQAGTDSIIAKVEQGIEVRVVTNSLAATDVLAVHSGYTQYRRQLVEAGVIVYELKANLASRYKKEKKISFKGSSRSSLHAKTFVVDDTASFVGSFNFDPRSAVLNTEMGVIIDDQPFTQLYLAEIDAKLNNKVYQVKVEQGRLVWLDLATGEKLTHEPDTSLWQRFMANLLSYLPIESQL